MISRRAALGLAFGAAAFGAETSAQRGRRVVNEALAALGGEKFLAMQDRVETGRVYSFFREELRGLSRARIYTRYLSGAAAAPDGFPAQRERQSFGKKDEESAVLFADGKGWEITFRGARPVPDDSLARYQESSLRNIFYILRMRLREPGLVFESRGTDIVDNQPVEMVDVTDSANRTTSVAFHRSTKLPIRQMFYRRDPKTRDRFEEVTIFSKYRDVGDGVLWPFTIERMRDGEKVYEIYSETVEIDKGLTDDLFTLPGNIKVLPKAK